MGNDCCPACGALSTAEHGSCQEIFDRFLILEYTDPDYGAVHMLTVAGFMIQHYRYSKEGLEWITAKLRAVLDNKLAAQQIRLESSGEVNSGRRSWRVTRKPDDPAPEHINWTMTIADVAAQYTDASSYQTLITYWVRTILTNLDAAQ